MWLLIGVVITVMLMFRRDSSEEKHERMIDRVLFLELMGQMNEDKLPRY